MKAKIIVNYLIGFIISVLISITALSLIAKLTVFNKDYIINLLEKENYFEKIYNEILEEMESDIMPSGFTNDIIKDTFTKDEVKEDIKTFINNVYQGNKTTLDKELLKDKIKKNIDDFLLKSNLKITDKNGVNTFVNDLVKDYQDEVCLYSYTDGLINTFYKIYHIINKVVIVLLIVLFVLIFLAKLLFKYNYLSSSILASGLIILFIRIFIYERIDADYLLVITENFSNILTLIINTIGNYLLSIGIGLVVFGVITICQVFLKKCQNKR
jgi:hypothetical protein